MEKKKKKKKRPRVDSCFFALVEYSNYNYTEHYLLITAIHEL